MINYAFPLLFTAFLYPIHIAASSASASQPTTTTNEKKRKFDAAQRGSQNNAAEEKNAENNNKRLLLSSQPVVAPDAGPLGPHNHSNNSPVHSSSSDQNSGQRRPVPSPVPTPPISLPADEAIGSSIKSIAWCKENDTLGVTPPALYFTNLASHCAEFSKLHEAAASCEVGTAYMDRALKLIELQPEEESARMFMWNSVWADHAKNIATQATAFATKMAAYQAIFEKLKGAEPNKPDLGPVALRLAWDYHVAIRSKLDIYGLQRFDPEKLIAHCEIAMTLLKKLAKLIESGELAADSCRKLLTDAQNIHASARRIAFSPLNHKTQSSCPSAQALVRQTAAYVAMLEKVILAAVRTKCA